MPLGEMAKQLEENDATLLSLVMGLAQEVAALRVEVAMLRAGEQWERPLPGTLRGDWLDWPVLELATAPDIPR